MKIFKNKLSLQKEISKDKSISFVPTMGGLHKGHLSLIKMARKYKCKICVSIFINPKQFNNKRDFKKYPKSIKSDITELKKLKINYLYIPTYKDIYSFKPKNKIYLDKFSKILCGKFRKAHFKGVINVINRFLEIIKPRYIYLGFKDFQQLILIDRHIKKNKIKTKVIGCKTIREKNGVACSTRNLSLNKKQLRTASKIYKYLSNLKKIINKDQNFFISTSVRKDLILMGINKIDYIEIINSNVFQEITKTTKKFKLFIAYYIKNTRLIDNI